MTENNLATWINKVCHDAGQNKGIELHSPALRGAQVPGRWEVSCRLKRQNWTTVNLSYWISANSMLSDEVNLLWPFPLTPEQSEKFKNDINAKIDQMLEQISLVSSISNKQLPTEETSL